MIATTISSTFLLTILLLVGLFFFIKASVKDRIEAVKLISEQPEESLLAQLQQYFTDRSYRVAAVDADRNQVTFEGFVRPSWFLAIFLSLLGAIGILCIVLVLSMLFPQLGWLLLSLELLSPLAGIFYWQNAGRLEKVSLQFERLGGGETPTSHSLITVTAHRDELAALRQALPLQPSE